MTQEEKAKAYDEAMEKAREFQKSKDGLCVLTAESIFPQLRENEDERIRKSLIEFLTIIKGISESGRTTWTVRKGDAEMCKSSIAYLEKQKENVEKEYVFRPLAGTDITIAAEQAIRRADEGDRLVLAFNGAYIPVRKGCNANKIVDIYDAFIEKQKDASKAIEAVDRIDKYIDEHLANAHDMKDSNPDKKYYRGWDDALGEMARILQDVYSGEKQKEQNGEDEECTDFTIYYPLKNGKGEYECIPYSFYDSLTFFSEDKDLIDFHRTCFYTEEECNEWIEQHKEEEGYEAIPVESTLEYKLGLKADKESEKQKEQKQECGKKGLKGPQEIGDWRGDEGVCKKQKEQKPKAKAKSPLSPHELYDAKIEGISQGRQDVLDHPEQFGLQKPAEWSPTKEQMVALSWAANGMLDNDSPSAGDIKASLRTLYNDLKSKSIRPAEWSDEDSDNLEKVDNYLWMLDDYVGDDCAMPQGKTDKIRGNIQGILSPWLKNLPKRFNLQPKQEWNEEEKGKVAEYLHATNGGMLWSTATEITEDILDILRPQKLDASKLENFDPVDVLNRIKTEWPMAWEKVVGNQEWSEEDEKMRENIISDLRYFRDCETDEEAVSDYDDEIAWLKDISLSLKKHNEAVEKLCSNEWTEEDEKMINTLVSYVGNPSCWNLKCPREKLVAFIESLPKKFSSQPKQEWSEEDESFLDSIEEAIHSYYDLNHAPQYDYWLEKKLKSLPETWKPSEEHLKYLLMLADYFESEGGTSNAKTLREFSEDLRKLI